MEIFMQNNNCFFPTTGPAGTSSATPNLALAIRCPNFNNFNTVKLLDRMTDLNLISLLIHLKRVCVQLAGKVHTLLGY
jgi:hypothetical protein